MAKFLDTTGVSYYLQQLINNAAERLILISPFLKINERIKQSLEDKNRFKIDIRIIYGKNELQPEENDWLISLKSVRLGFCKNLHAKCYLNESEAVLTSMNLYDFSEINNNEMGILITRNDDPEVYKSIYDEAMRLIRISDEIGISKENNGTDTNNNEIDTNNNEIDTNNNEIDTNSSEKGFCIRCKKEIEQKISKPYCIECFKIWVKFKNRNFKESFCHICGNDYASSLNKPICQDCYQKNNAKGEK